MIDESKKHDFSDFQGTGQVVSSDDADYMQTVTVTYRDATGAVQTVNIALDGLTPVPDAAIFERIEKAEKDGPCAGDVALEKQTAVRTGTLLGPGDAVDEVQLDAGASAVSGEYVGMVFRATAGLGSGKIAEIISYDGDTKVAGLSRDVSTVFNATTVFRISKGVFFDRTPSEIMTVVRHFMTSSADPLGGADKNYYQKGFFKHTDASGSGLPLTLCEISKGGGPLSLTFALDDVVSDPYPTSNGVYSNRLVAPSDGVGGPYDTFDALAKDVPGGTLEPGDTVGVWVKIERLDGAVALKTTWVPGFDGQSV